MSSEVKIQMKMVCLGDEGKLIGERKMRQGRKEGRERMYCQGHLCGHLGLGPAGKPPGREQKAFGGDFSHLNEAWRN